MLRGLLVVAVLVPLTAMAALLQALSLALSASASRIVPVRFHGLFCALLGVQVTVRGEPLHGRPVLLVSNHVSWVDIPVLGSVTALFFVAKSEIAGWPVFGFLSKLQRTIFVHRARRHKTGEAAKAEIANRLSEGLPVVLFAEGTSSDGNRVLPFRSSLVGAARDALTALGEDQPVYVQPVSIAYVGLHGMPMGRHKRPIVAWYGDIDLLPHLWSLVRSGGIDAVVSFGPAIRYEAGADRKALTAQLNQTVRHMTTEALRGLPELQAGRFSFRPKTAMSRPIGRVAGTNTERSTTALPSHGDGP